MLREGARLTQVKRGPFGVSEDGDRCKRTQGVARHIRCGERLELVEEALPEKGAASSVPAQQGHTA